MPNSEKKYDKQWTPLYSTSDIDRDTSYYSDYYEDNDYNYDYPNEKYDSYDEELESWSNAKPRSLSVHERLEKLFREKAWN